MKNSALTLRFVLSLAAVALLAITSGCQCQTPAQPLNPGPHSRDSKDSPMVRNPGPHSGS